LLILDSKQEIVNNNRNQFAAKLNQVFDANQVVPAYSPPKDAGKDYFTATQEQPGFETVIPAFDSLDTQSLRKEEDKLNLNDLDSIHAATEIDLDAFLTKHGFDPSSSIYDSDSGLDNINATIEKSTHQYLHESTVAQYSQISIPLIRPSIQESVLAILKHLIFEFTPNTIDYFNLYRKGLLSGGLQEIQLDDSDIPKDRKAYEPLHPVLKNVLMMDVCLFIDLVQDWDPPEHGMLGLDSKQRLISFLVGLGSLHRHLLPMSTAMHKMSKCLCAIITVPQAMVLVHDKIAIIKLSLKGKLPIGTNRAGILPSEKIEDVNKSWIAGSVANLNYNVIDWVSNLM
jgi:hypothetical protein